MSNSVLDSEFNPILEQVKATLGEHYINYYFIVMDENGDTYHDFTNIPIAKMLVQEGADQINQTYKAIDIEWEDEE
tara:strand:+ start:147 stop:374 length:228 start_codon:yes stop_codon:yes gene_type:complete